MLNQVSSKHVEDILCNLFLWKKGDFHYEDGLPNLEGKVVTRIGTMNLILEASRRIDEMSLLTSAIPSDKLIFMMSGRVADGEEIKLNADEWRILSLVDGKRTVRQVVTSSGYDDLAVYQTLYSLRSTGLIKESGRVGPHQEDGDVDVSLIVKGDEKKTILVVDDMSQIRNILRFSLRKKGYNVVLAENGPEALRYCLSQNPVDVIILDIMMPKMDGYEVIRQLRESDITKDIPVIFLTAKAQKIDVQKGIDAGANDYVVKPYKFVDLQSKIEKLIDQR